MVVGDRETKHIHASTTNVRVLELFDLMQCVEHRANATQDMIDSTTQATKKH